MKNNLIASFLMLICCLNPSIVYAAFPAVATTGYSEETADVTTHDVVVPSGIASGNLLLWYSCNDGSPTISNVPGDWNQLDSSEESTILKARLYYKFASGSESNFTYTTDVGEKSINYIMRITGAHATEVPAFNAATNISTTPNSLDLNPANWDVEDTLWFSAYCMDRDAGTVNTYPTNYTDNQYTDASGTGTSSSNVSVGFSSRALAAASENPGAYATNDASARRWYAYTIAVRPAAATTSKPKTIIIQ